MSLSQISDWQWQKWQWIWWLGMPFGIVDRHHTSVFEFLPWYTWFVAILAQDHFASHNCHEFFQILTFRKLAKLEHIPNGVEGLKVYPATGGIPPPATEWCAMPTRTLRDRGIFGHDGSEHSQRQRKCCKSFMKPSPCHNSHEVIKTELSDSVKYKSETVCFKSMWFPQHRKTSCDKNHSNKLPTTRNGSSHVMYYFGS